ncbi:Altered inheritance of mitochondria protein 36, mitochondrial [Nakaseomyces bracarensis]|uniref:Altered inheritance of mitochondria protein 36, mitochondrial n=1 Tax=Nakaseomyces bracarensis TaxID=273131 RepID=A0ABR4NZ48_9SACH
MLRRSVFGRFRAVPRYINVRYKSTIKPREIPRANDGSELPSAKKLILIALGGTAIFVGVVNSLDKQQPKNSYSEAEFENLTKGLKRKVALFPNDSVSVYCVMNSDANAVQKRVNVQRDQIKVVDPYNVVESHRTTTDDRYEALLNNLYDRYGAQEYFERLPQGLLIKLLSLEMKEKCETGDTIIVTNFPQSIKDASAFETDIASVSKLYVPKELQQSDVCKYYQTVDKVETL